ncbi:Mg chelatase-like protein [Frankia sp. CcI49]|uniref:YifB family Mg chelatase-like AAA ATPase n=1 Tax=Frankia sp. CcI49 TaxID=1745382 RepID=UPI00097612BC|nr:YifB family Mg chelatase-like AAA ATPase [Frankia sp. CcI49]ONH60310.1 Mg chelatase-like protein [Frankia sp. CcI49]
MALARSLAVAVVGIEGRLVEVEADLGRGLPGFTLIGLPDAALHEARDRVRAAVVNSREHWPDQKITVGLFPATLPKSGSGFDLAMAAAILGAAGAVPSGALASRILIGELALDGRLRPVRGVLPAVLAAVEAGLERIVVPVANAAEASLVPDAVIEPMHDLAGVLALLRGRPTAVLLPAGAAQPVDPGEPADPGETMPDLADVAGQVRGRLAVEVAAAGGHHLFMLGPPGSGKSMLAERLPGLLPTLDFRAALEVTAVHSVAGVLPVGRPLVTRPPFRNPHHSATPAALIGSGSPAIRPGLASQAHHGVLFLDESPEFGRSSLDALRQPLESGLIEVARARATTRFPARFLLVLAANPCPCSRARGPRDARCDCPSTVRRRYLARLSGPLLDRIDIQVQLNSPSRAELKADRGHASSSRTIAERVARARSAMEKRFAGTPWRRNSDVPGPAWRHRWPLLPEATRLADRAFDRGLLTARGLDRVFRVAWTIADLAEVERPGAAEVGLALDLRLPGWSA